MQFFWLLSHLDEAVRWVIEEQRQQENLRQVGLERDDLRLALGEAAVCVMQSGNETAKISFLEARLAQDSNNPVYALLQAARKEVDVSDSKLLNNLCNTALPERIVAAGIDRDRDCDQLPQVLQPTFRPSHWHTLNYLPFQQSR